MRPRRKPSSAWKPTVRRLPPESGQRVASQRSSPNAPCRPSWLAESDGILRCFVIGSDVISHSKKRARYHFAATGIASTNMPGGQQGQLLRRRDLFNDDDDSRGLVAWVFPRRFPWRACTIPTASSGRPRCGAALPPSGSCNWESESELQHLC
jgi:hypothetical protein